MKDYEKNAAKRRARAEVALVFKRIQEELLDRAMGYLDAAHAKAITDGSTFDADQVGKDSAAYGAEPWSLNAAPALAHESPAPRKARAR